MCNVLNDLLLHEHAMKRALFSLAILVSLPGGSIWEVSAVRTMVKLGSTKHGSRSNGTTRLTDLRNRTRTFDGRPLVGPDGRFEPAPLVSSKNVSDSTVVDVTTAAPLKATPSSAYAGTPHQLTLPSRKNASASAPVVLGGHTPPAAAAALPAAAAAAAATAAAAGPGLSPGNLEAFAVASASLVTGPVPQVVKAAESPVVKAAESTVVKAAESTVVKAGESPVVKAAESPVVKAAESPVVKAAAAPVVTLVKAAEAPVVTLVKAAESPVVKAPESPSLRQPVATLAEKAAATVVASTVAASTATSERAAAAAAWPPTVEHQKEADNGYKEGSPLYEHQTPQSQPLPRTPQGAFGAWRGFLAEHHRISVISVLTYGILVLVAAYLYQKYGDLTLVPNRLKSRAAPMCAIWTRCGFEYSLCDVGNLDEDWLICLMACFCPIVRWAATASKGPQPFLEFWPALAMMLVLTILTPYTLGITGLIMLCIMNHFRSKLRKVYNHTMPEELAECSDCCITICFANIGCCALVQEAREVEFNYPRLVEWPAVALRPPSMVQRAF